MQERRRCAFFIGCESGGRAWGGPAPPAGKSDETTGVVHEAVPRLHYAKPEALHASGLSFLRDMSKFPMTVEGAERLRAELHRLKTVERPAVIQALADARSHGDLSENADYDAAKERQGFIEGRIADVERKLANAQVIDPTTIEADGRVVFGATVEIEELDSGERNRYQIVGDDEADIKAGKISVSSPIARALIGRIEGDTTEVQAPGGVRAYEIVTVDYR
jgi:transcription elongation factor GreA